MRFLRNIGYVLYRIWFYVLVALPIVVLFPILIVSILKDSWYPFFFRLARFWSKLILFGMGFYPKVKRDVKFEKGKSYMFVANHTSMTDIMLMLYVVSRNPFVFVGKAELAKIPLFGFFYKRTCILVDRSDAKSRLNVFTEAQKRLQRGLSVCIFPEGGVPDDETMLLNQFKDGAFRLAIEHKIPIAPMTFHDNKKRFSYTFFSGGPGKMRVRVHDIIPTGILELEDKRMLRDQTRELILEELQNPSIHG
ncbi:lysophospholipid acyltransferase family protein [Aureisphaera galaxeae]|uniref:lysophospholipid acyltransferase family protein n=1 Tax=Aureisphaera galaxeae TaxID=1538023 RepID=UPI002350C0FF|nr:lysophospholipid acyltransferase family protein [Aureisphaera galaxeae]MDC8005033.1 lysophospholipid acyltransferase family protein [Aureisphaera galaxeae]